MKRAAVFAMVIVVIASAWTFLAAQSSPSGFQKASPEPIAPAPPQSPKYERERVPATAPQMHDRDRLTGPSVTPLQQRYVDLATKKARLMTEEQLQQAVNELDHDVHELDAWSKVDEVARQLREVIDKHPQTQAAEAARSALNVIEQSRSHGPLTEGKRYEREKLERRDKAESPFGASAPAPSGPETFGPKV
jgi:hypothetical protein